MKRTFLFVWILALPLANAFSQREAEGILVYQEPATSYTEAMEFRSFHEDNALYSTITPVNGPHKQVKTAGVLAVSDYPPVTFDSSFPDAARSALEKLRTLESEYPRIRGQLETARAKWERALSVYEQTAGSHPASPINASLPSLEVNGETYSHVRLNAITGDSLTISHDAGIARIPIQKLNVSQIVGLNTTSKTNQLGTFIQPEKPREMENAEPTSLTSKLKDAGMGVVGWIHRETGISSDAIWVWLLFVILPVLIVTLVVVNIVQGRKLKAVR